MAHGASEELSSIDQRWRLIATTAWTLSGTGLYVLLPGLAPGVLALCALAPMAWCLDTSARFRFSRPPAAILGLFFGGIYLFLNATWSPSPASAYFHLGWFCISIASLYITLVSLRRTQHQALRAMAFGVIGGLMIGGAFLCFEAFSEQLIHRLLLTYVPALRPAPHRVHVEAGWVSFLEPALIDRSIAALTLLIWPAALMVLGLGLNPHQRAPALLALVPAVAAIFRSPHATSKMAFLGAAIVYGIALVWPTLARRMMVASWVAATILVVPMVMFAYSNQLYRVDWLPGTARQRVVIWGYTSGLVLKAPFLGTGIDAARALNEPDNLNLPRAPGTDFRLTTSQHSHNAYLQVWFDTGVIGAVFLLSIGLLVFGDLKRARSRIQPFLLATFASCALMGATSFSLWAPWFVASFGIVAVFAALASHVANQEIERAIGSNGNEPFRRLSGDGAPAFEHNGC